MKTLFDPLVLGPITLRNRSIRAAAFEGMSQHNAVTEDLINYHQAVAKGEIGMTTVAYAAVSKSGLSFTHQLLLQDSIVPDLRKLTDAIHAQGAAASIQIGHCGNMAKYGIIGQRPLAPSTHINLYAPSFPRAMHKNDIAQLIFDFKNAVRIAQEGGFDAVEIHAGHGYLISQFLSPYSNKRKDVYGGSLENRMRLMSEVVEAALEQAGDRTAVLVKMNMSDGFPKGMQLDESLQVAQRLEKLGVHALVLSGGYVSKAPMYVMRGKMPMDVLANGMPNVIMKYFVKWFGNNLVQDVPFSNHYFLEQAKLFRAQLNVPLIYVGGILSEKDINDVLSENFDGIAIARALIQNPDFIKNIKNRINLTSRCTICNHCVASIYNGPFECLIKELNLKYANHRFHKFS